MSLDKLKNAIRCGRDITNERFRDLILSALYTLVEQSCSESSNAITNTGWITESTIGEDFTADSDPIEYLTAPGAGKAIVIRYLSYSNGSAASDTVYFQATSDIYPNFLVPGSIWATRFNKNDYLILPEDEGLFLHSDNQLINSLNVTIEYKIIDI